MTNTLQFVEIQNEVAVIDSRVYCQDVIMVEHSDWMSNVLYKYQDIIREHFGEITFRTAMQDIITIPLSVLKTEGGNVTTKYALLTEAQCNFALTLSRNTPEVVINKAKLIADFENAKQIIRANLERQLTASLQPSDKHNEKMAKIKQQLKNVTESLASWRKRYKEEAKECAWLREKLIDSDREEMELRIYHSENRKLEKEVEKLTKQLQSIGYQTKDTPSGRKTKQTKGFKSTDKTP